MQNVHGGIVRFSFTTISFSPARKKAISLPSGILSEAALA
nr:MAG TPA: hypothetical protein [Caudoviricetes sp.]